MNEMNIMNAALKQISVITSTFYIKLHQKNMLKNAKNC